MPDPARTLEGNRIWRVDTERGPVLQKLYNRRGRWPREEFRALLGALLGRKSSPRAAARRATERRLLALWREAGIDVPTEVSESHPELAGPDHLLLEDIPGVPLLHLLRRKAGAPRPRRDELLRRFAADWARRHDLALQQDQPALVHEHGSFEHTLVAGERHVTIDLEQGWKPGQAVLPLLAKEIADTLRSLAGRVQPDVFQGDVATLVDAYGNQQRLQQVVREYRASPSPLRRLVWCADRALQRLAGRTTSKYVALEVLEQVLAERDRAQSGDAETSATRPS